MANSIQSNNSVKDFGTWRIYLHGDPTKKPHNRWNNPMHLRNLAARLNKTRPNFTNGYTGSRLLNRSDRKIIRLLLNRFRADKFGDTAVIAILEALERF